MKLSIRHIVDELIALDPEFKVREQELVLLVKELIEKKPDIAIDDTFVATLRDRLVGKKKDVRRYSPWSSFLFTPFAISGMGLVVILVAVGIFAVRWPQGTITLPERMAGQGDIISVAANAFGNLVAPPSVSGVVAPLGTDKAMSSLSKEAAVGFGGATASVPSPLIYPVERFVYEYVGDELTVPATELPVYRRIPLKIDTTSFAAALAGTLDTWFGLSTFDNIAVQQVQLISDTDSGYMLSLDMFDGRMQINPYYEKWYMGRDISQPLKEAEMIADDEAIRIARDFLADHKIDTSKHGAPVVDVSWKQYALSANDIRYVPDSAGVIFPIVPEGNMVVDYGGQPYGLRVNVDVRTKKAQGAWNISREQYERSLYAIEADPQRILDVISRQYSSDLYAKDTQVKTISIALGTPELVYLLQGRYNEQTKRHEEFYVPGWRFPVLGDNAPQYHSKYVITPITKEYIDQNQVIKDLPVQILRPEPAVTLPVER